MNVSKCKKSVSTIVNLGEGVNGFKSHINRMNPFKGTLKSKILVIQFAKQKSQTYQLSLFILSNLKKKNPLLRYIAERKYQIRN